jgi:phthiocerol/phenolphthiocerol synthesis type-I polyketide synthase E
MDETAPVPEDWRAVNRALWDERVPIHLDSAFYDVAGFLAGGSTLRAFELDELRDVAGLTLVHPQCHFGLDTLSWARRGAHVTGLDFSGAAVAAARRLAAEAKLDAEFVEADVYAAPEALGGRRFDVVYTGLGALNWLPDVERWAGVMASLVAPGGRLYLAEFHPFPEVFADDELRVAHPYFDPAPYRGEEAGTYANPDAATVHNRYVVFQHTLGSVVSAIAAAGLRIEFLHEHDHTLFARWPFLQPHPDGIFRLPEGAPALPLMYSLLALSR